MINWWDLNANWLCVLDIYKDIYVSAIIYSKWSPAVYKWQTWLSKSIWLFLDIVYKIRIQDKLLTIS